MPMITSRRSFVPSWRSARDGWFDPVIAAIVRQGYPFSLDMWPILQKIFTQSIQQPWQQLEQKMCLWYPSYKTWYKKLDDFQHDLLVNLWMQKRFGLLLATVTKAAKIPKNFYNTYCITVCQLDKRRAEKWPDDIEQHSLVKTVESLKPLFAPEVAQVVASITPASLRLRAKL